jgi:hypothetical protein
MTDKILEEVQGMDELDRDKELLEAATALEIASITLVNLAERLGNTDAEGDVSELFENSKGLIRSYIEISASSIADKIDQTPVPIYYTMPGGEA